MFLETSAQLEPTRRYFRPRFIQIVTTVTIWPHVWPERVYLTTDLGTDDAPRLSDTGCIDATNRIPAGGLVKFTDDLENGGHIDIWPAYIDRDH